MGGALRGLSNASTCIALMGRVLGTGGLPLMVGVWPFATCRDFCRASSLIGVEAADLDGVGRSEEAGLSSFVF